MYIVFSVLVRNSALVFYSVTASDLFRIFISESFLIPRHGLGEGIIGMHFVRQSVLPLHFVSAL